MVDAPFSPEQLAALQTAIKTAVNVTFQKFYLQTTIEAAVDATFQQFYRDSMLP